MEVSDHQLESHHCETCVGQSGYNCGARAEVVMVLVRTERRQVTEEVRKKKRAKYKQNQRKQQRQVPEKQQQVPDIQSLQRGTSCKARAEDLVCDNSWGWQRELP